MCRFYRIWYCTASVSSIILSGWIQLTQGSLTVKSAAFDSKLGGRDMDWAIAQHAADEFQAKTGKVSSREQLC